jgi:glutaredoxin 3
LSYGTEGATFGAEETVVAEVEIYTQPWCPYCSKAKRILDGKGVQYTEIEAPQGTPERAEAARRSGAMTVPQIFINGQSIGGCDDLQALDTAGKLDTLLSAA